MSNPVLATASDFLSLYSKLQETFYERKQATASSDLPSSDPIDSASPLPEFLVQGSFDALEQAASGDSSGDSDSDDYDPWQIDTSEHAPVRNNQPDQWERDAPSSSRMNDSVASLNVSSPQQPFLSKSPSNVQQVQSLEPPRLCSDWDEFISRVSFPKPAPALKARPTSGSVQGTLEPRHHLLDGCAPEDVLAESRYPPLALEPLSVRRASESDVQKVCSDLAAYDQTHRPPSGTLRQYLSSSSWSKTTIPNEDERYEVAPSYTEKHSDALQTRRFSEPTCSQKQPLASSRWANTTPPTGFERPEAKSTLRWSDLEGSKDSEFSCLSSEDKRMMIELGRAIAVSHSTSGTRKQIGGQIEGAQRKIRYDRDFLLSFRNHGQPPTTIQMIVETIQEANTKSAALRNSPSHSRNSTYTPKGSYEGQLEPSMERSKAEAIKAHAQVHRSQGPSCGRLGGQDFSFKREPLGPPPLHEKENGFLAHKLRVLD